MRAALDGEPIMHVMTERPSAIFTGNRQDSPLGAELTCVGVRTHIASASRNVYASGYTTGMRVPEVLSFREFRTTLAATLRRVQEPDADPVFVGAHRRPEAVVLSVARYEELVEGAARRADVDEALASVRAEGLEPSAQGRVLLDGVASGQLSTAQARERVLARYGR